MSTIAGDKPPRREIVFISRPRFIGNRKPDRIPTLAWEFSIRWRGDEDKLGWRLWFNFQYRKWHAAHVADAVGEDTEDLFEKYQVRPGLSKVTPELLLEYIPDKIKAEAFAAAIKIARGR